jgi:lipoprotein-releasing system ATP-binding protein
MNSSTYLSASCVSSLREGRAGLAPETFLARSDQPPATAQQPVERAPAPAAEPLLSATKLYKSYRKSKHIIPVLRGVDFAVRPGEFVAIVGQSGSGKTTLLHLLGTLDEPEAGEIQFEQNRIDNLPSQARDMLRNRYFGMIFQFYHLLPELTTLENVLAPRMIGDGVIRYWMNRRKHAVHARQLLDMVGLGHRLTHKPKELSGGEMQRAAIARALIGNPRLLLADEPTGNLDRQTGQEIMALLRSLNREQNLTIVMVTHDNAIAALADRTVRLVEGLVERVA